VILPASEFFSTAQLRKNPPALDLVVYGPAHLFRKAWLSGVRDYLRDPWLPEELFLRVRGPLPSSLKWDWGEYNLSLRGTKLIEDSSSKEIRLSRAEADLLRVLAQRQGQAVSRNLLAWAAQCSEGRVIDTLMARLRKKIQAISSVEDDPVPSIRGFGYRLP